MDHTADTLNADRPLWAPWRIEYIRSIKEDECFLCTSHSDDPEASKLVIARGESCYVLLNAYPYNAGHALVAPYEHQPDLSDLPESTVHEMTSMILITKQVMQEVMAPQGYNYGYNLGAAAGAGCAAHVHGHLVPRWHGDTNFMPVIGNTRVIPESLFATAELLRDNWPENQDARE